MKCPDCQANQRRRAGLRCGKCGYEFAFDPKRAPYLTDGVVNRAAQRLSQEGTQHFTFNQLFGAVFALAEKKHGRLAGVVILACIIGIPATIFAVNPPGDVAIVRWMALAVLVLVASLTVREVSRRVRQGNFVLEAEILPRLERFVGATRTKPDQSPLRRLVTAETLAEISQGPGVEQRLLDEIQQYAPQHLLIVERDDLTAALILNQFHFNNSCLVVSASKQPPTVFRVCAHHLASHQGLTVYVAHDYSPDGLRLAERLRNDPEWNLQAHTLVDLGLDENTLSALGRVVWRTGDRTGHGFLRQASPSENLAHGYVVPLDHVRPGVLTPMLVACVAEGLLLSAAYAHVRTANPSSADAAGYG